MKIKNWWYNEAHCGVNYDNQEIASAYDAAHLQFRDYEHEAAHIVNELQIKPDHVIVDMGTGTGAFPLHAASCCKTVYAVDISRAMLDVASAKAKELQIENIHFIQAGFLSYQHAGNAVDCVVSTVALHHLPDFWKMIALQRIYDMLKPGGKLYLQDVVFPAKASRQPDLLETWVAEMHHSGDKEMAEEAVVHLRDEFSTYNWILEGMLERVGFSIQSYNYIAHLMAAYVCVKDGGG